MHTWTLHYFSKKKKIMHLASAIKVGKGILYPSLIRVVIKSILKISGSASEKHGPRTKRYIRKIIFD